MWNRVRTWGDFELLEVFLSFFWRAHLSSWLTDIQGCLTINISAVHCTFTADAMTFIKKKKEKVKVKCLRWNDIAIKMRFIVIELINIGKLVLAFRCLCSDMPMLNTSFGYILYPLYSSCWCAHLYLKGEHRVHYGWTTTRLSFSSRLHWLAAFRWARCRSLTPKWHLSSVLIVHQQMTSQIGEGRSYSPAATGCDWLHVPWDSFPRSCLFCCVCVCFFMTISFFNLCIKSHFSEKRGEQ